MHQDIPEGQATRIKEATARLNATSSSSFARSNGAVRWNGLRQLLVKRKHRRKEDALTFSRSEACGGTLVGSISNIIGSRLENED